MDDAAFLARFEACAIPLEEWDHKAHLRVAWTYLRHGLNGATERMRAGIRCHHLRTTTDIEQLTELFA